MKKIIGGICLLPATALLIMCFVFAFMESIATGIAVIFLIIVCIIAAIGIILLTE
jgi:hypothetical protein